MAFTDVRLSTRVEAGFSAVPMRLTRVSTLANGNEKRNAQWVNAKRRYTSQYAGFTRAERNELLAFVEAMEGQLYAFRFKDWNDFNVTDEPLGVAPAGSTPVQLVKSYTAGVRTKTREITKPVIATVVVYQNGVAKAGTTDPLTGLFTPTTAWTGSAVLTWTGEFDVPVRFASDEIEFVMPHREISQVNCELVEVFN